MTLLTARDPAVISNRAGQLILKIAASSFGAFLVGRVVAQLFDNPYSYALIGLLICETLTLGLLIFSRIPKDQSLSCKSVIYTLVPCMLLPLCNLSPGASILPPVLAFTLFVLSLLLQLHAKMTIGRSFGLLPANRGVVDTGPYQMVRHPIYLSYVLHNLAFLAAAFHWWNLVLLGTSQAVQWLRILEEEKVLGRDPAYRDYMTRVRWRIFPGLL